MICEQPHRQLHKPLEHTCTSLRIRLNNILGYFVVVPPSKADRMVGNETFQRCHSTKTGERFKTQVTFFFVLLCLAAVCSP